MSANKNGNAPVKASVKRMHRPHRLEQGIRGHDKIFNLIWRGIAITEFKIRNNIK